MAIKDMGAFVLTRLKKQAKETGINYQPCPSWIQFITIIFSRRYGVKKQKAGCKYIELVIGIV